MGTYLGESAEDLSANARGVDVRELQSAALGQVAIEDDALGVHNLANKGDHADAAVLPLDSAAALEGLGLSVEPSEGIKDAEGLGDSQLELIHHLHGGGGGGGNRGVERTGGGDKGGGESVLHGCWWICEGEGEGW